MPTITVVQYQSAYDIAKHISMHSLSISEGANNLSRSVGMDVGSAKDYLNVLTSMRQGNVYKRTVKIDAYRYYLERFSKELPSEEFSKVLDSVSLHLDYYSSLGKGNQPTVNSIVENYKTRVVIPINNVVYPDEVDLKLLKYTEGEVKQVTINAYERDLNARAACIAEFGAVCQVCKFNFEAVYGEIGKGFIHVHHKVDIATIGKSYQINPIKDLVPVCPNCHAMLHTEIPAMKVEILTKLLKSKFHN